MSAALLAIVFGLVAACCFGVGDFLVQRLTRGRGWFAAMVAVQLAAALILGLVASVWELAGDQTHASIRAAWLAVLGLGVANTVGLVGLYRAFERGKLSLVSPIAGSMGAFAVAFAWLAGTPPAGMIVPGLAAVVLGIVVASVVVDPPGEADGAAVHGARGVGWALLSAAAFGWVFYCLGPSGELVGPAWTVFWLRIVALVGLALLAVISGWPLIEPTLALIREERGRLLVVALLDSGGMLTFAYASAQLALGRALAILVVLVSCFPIVTVALAQLRLRESLRWWQWCGVIAVVLGIGWISAWSS